ncbi:MAG TPA: hypothetical protein VMW16_11355 [Sedimentisphaerales bacterium]|nr:hypothetical protein [Sedimentisphaerales bacterium]
MRRIFSKNTVKDRLNYLHSKLPSKPTAVLEPYSLPEDGLKDVRQSNYSQASLQRISDHIGYYLGLFESVRISFVEEREKIWVSTNDGTLTYGKNKSPVCGLYKRASPGHSEILLLKKPDFGIEHILAILAHECIHNYLYHHRINDSDELENEVLTDLAAAYLGLGALILDGYEAITWEIGYVTAKDIRYAIVYSAKLRKLKELASFLPVFDRINVSFYFWGQKLLRAWRSPWARSW